METVQIISSKVKPGRLALWHRGQEITTDFIFNTYDDESMEESSKEEIQTDSFITSLNIRLSDIVGEVVETYFLGDRFTSGVF